MQECCKGRKNIKAKVMGFGQWCSTHSLLCEPGPTWTIEVSGFTSRGLTEYTGHMHPVIQEDHSSRTLLGGTACLSVSLAHKNKNKIKKEKEKAYTLKNKTKKNKVSMVPRDQ